MHILCAERRSVHLLSVVIFVDGVLHHDPVHLRLHGLGLIGSERFVNLWLLWVCIFDNGFLHPLTVSEYLLLIVHAILRENPTSLLVCAEDGDCAISFVTYISKFLPT